jgi:hypothetical protein
MKAESLQHVSSGFASYSGQFALGSETDLQPSTPPESMRNAASSVKFFATAIESVNLMDEHFEGHSTLTHE